VGWLDTPRGNLVMRLTLVITTWLTSIALPLDTLPPNMHLGPGGL
jgi:hypothetical protein